MLPTDDTTAGKIERLQALRDEAGHQGSERAVARQRPLEGEGELLGLRAQTLAREPTPAEAAALADTLEQLFRGLEPLQRRMVEMRLQGFSLDEIADDVRRSERTVRRLLEQVKERLREECPGGRGKDEG